MHLLVGSSILLLYNIFIFFNIYFYNLLWLLFQTARPVLHVLDCASEQSPPNFLLYNCFKLPSFWYKHKNVMIFKQLGYSWEHRKRAPVKWCWSPNLVSVGNKRNRNRGNTGASPRAAFGTTPCPGTCRTPQSKRCIFNACYHVLFSALQMPNTNRSVAVKSQRSQSQLTK